MSFLDKLKKLLGLNYQKVESIILDNNIIVLSQEKKNVKIIINNLLRAVLINQTVVSTIQLINSNYQVVKEHYLIKSAETVLDDDLSTICLNIVIKHLHMYNMWRSMYKNQRERNLKFLSTDFDSSTAVDEIIAYFKRKYPKDYSRQCRTLLGLMPGDFAALEIRRNNYLNK